jgi:hypothetical protein
MKKNMAIALKVAPLVVAGALVLFGLSSIFKEFIFESEMASFYKFADRYSSSWNISQEEYEHLKGLVISTFKKDELIMGVHVVDPTEVHFQILEYYDGPLAAGGYGLRAKKENGKWTIAHSGVFWNSALPGVSPLTGTGVLSV